MFLKKSYHAVVVTVYDMFSPLPIMNASMIEGVSGSCSHAGLLGLAYGCASLPRNSNIYGKIFYINQRVFDKKRCHAVIVMYQGFTMKKGGGGVRKGR